MIRPEKKRNRKTERNLQICLLRQQGQSYKAIAERYQISVARVRQILEVWNGSEIEAGGQDQVPQQC